MKESSEIAKEQERSSESAQARQERYAKGAIREDELQAHWENPAQPLFEHELVRIDKEGNEQRTRFRVRALTEEFKQPLLDAVKNSWEDIDFEDLTGTLERFFEQHALGHPGIVNVEYYIATDVGDKPFAITGIYTTDMEGGAGFATRDRLPSAEHHLVTGLGWFAVSTEYQGSGIGGFLLDWTENMARTRGARVMAIETDDWKNEEAALRLYEKRGYQAGFNVKDYYGPGRDRHVYHLDTTKSPIKHIEMPEERISKENQKEIFALASRVYSSARFAEFKAALDLLMQHEEGDTTILTPESFVLRNAAGDIESFTIFSNALYENLLANYWYCSEPDDKDAEVRLMTALVSVTKSRERDILVAYREGEDSSLAEYGFRSSDRGIPGVFIKGDPTKFLFYTKKL